MNKFDDTNGQVIGGEYGQAWLTYEGRKQGATIYPASREQANAELAARLNEIKADCGEAFRAIYPKANCWQFHYSGI